MADIIATEAEAKSIGGSSASITTNLCCTKARAEALNCLVSNSDSYYTSQNLLVRKKDLSKATFTVTLKAYFLDSTTVAPTCSVSGGGTFTVGDSATIHAADGNCYTFVKWNDGNTDVNRTVTTGGTYIAYFVIDWYFLIHTSSNSNFWGTLYSSNSTSDSYATSGFLSLFESNTNTNNIYRTYINDTLYSNARTMPYNVTLSGTSVSAYSGFIPLTNTEYMIHILLKNLSSIDYVGKNWITTSRFSTLYPGIMDSLCISIPEGITSIQADMFYLCDDVVFCPRTNNAGRSINNEMNRYFIFPSTFSTIECLDFKYRRMNTETSISYPTINIYFCGNIPTINSISSGLRVFSTDGTASNTSSVYPGIINIHYTNGCSITDLLALLSGKANSINYIADAPSTNSYRDIIWNT